MAPDEVIDIPQIALRREAPSRLRSRDRGGVQSFHLCLGGAATQLPCKIRNSLTTECLCRYFAAIVSRPTSTYLLERFTQSFDFRDRELHCFSVTVNSGHLRYSPFKSRHNVHCYYPSLLISGRLSVLRSAYQNPLGQFALHPAIQRMTRTCLSSQCHPGIRSSARP